MKWLKDLAGLGISDIIVGVFKPALELVDELHTSEEERLQAKANLLDAQAAAMDKVFKYETEMLSAKAAIVEAEAKSEHVITATWRPIVMLTFTALAVADATGILVTALAPEAWTLLQFGLGGYVVGRSGEKIVKTLKQ